MNANVSVRRFFSRSSKLRGSLCLRGGRLAPQGDQEVAGSLATLRLPFCWAEIEAMSQRVSISAARRYGLARVCRVWGIARSSAYFMRERQRRRGGQARQRPGPQGPPCGRGVTAGACATY